MAKNRDNKSRAIPKAKKRTGILSKRAVMFAGGGVVLLFAVAVIVYVVYPLITDSSSKLLTDSLRNTLNMKQSTYVLTYDNSFSTATGVASLKLEGKYNSALGHETSVTATLPANAGGFTAAADIVLDTNDGAYIRYKGIKYKASGSEGEAAQKAMDNILTDQWIKSNGQNLETVNGCELAAFQKLQSDEGMLSGLIASLQDSKGISVVEVSSTDESIAYKVKAEPSEVGVLVGAYKETDFYKYVQECSSSDEAAMSGLGDLIQYGTFDVTVDKRERKVKEVTVTRQQDKATMKLSLVVKPASGVTITIPKETVSSIEPTLKR